MVASHSLNMDLSGQFAKLLLHACDADVSAAAFAAVAADGTEAEVEIEDRDSPATCFRILYPACV